MTTRILFVLFLLFSFCSCQRAYFSALEKVGYHKRDILVKRVDKARDAQGEAKEQFSSALEEFTTVLNIKTGELGQAYEKLQASFDESEERAKDVSSRINQVEDVAEALFDEWEDELSSYSNPKLRNSSKKKLSATEGEYKNLIAAMKRAESKMDPVLDSFRDQVLYLKHNLNAQAISSLQSELGSIEANVSSLIKEMEKSMAEADSFIANIKS